MWRKLIMGGINFGLLDVWVPSPDWLRRRSDFVTRLGEAAAPGEGNAGHDPTQYRIPWHLPYN